MMKHKSMLCMIVLLLTFLLPWLVFQVMDRIDQSEFHTSEKLITDHGLMDTYPIISDIYANYYNEFTQNEDVVYDYTDLSIYQQPQQDRLQKIKALLEQELSTWMKQGILAPKYLNQQTDEYNIQFGTFHQSLSTIQGYYTLNQIFSIAEDKVISNETTILMNSKKLLRLSVTNDQVKQLTKKQQIKIAKKLIHYYELENINDWTENEFGYESYQAKLQIYCDMISYDESNPTLMMGIVPLGQYRASSIYDYSLHQYGFIFH